MRAVENPDNNSLQPHWIHMSIQANKLNNIKMAQHVKSTVYNDVKKNK